VVKKIGWLVVILAVLAGIGWYRGWFRVGTQNADGKRTVEFQLDKAKMEQDATRAEAKLKEDATRAETRAGELVPK
jgi:hypothetical protein